MYGQLLIHFVKRIVEEEVFFRTPGSRLVCAALVRRVFGVFTARKDKSLSIFDVMVGGADVCYIMRYRKHRTHLGPVLLHVVELFMLFFFVRSYIMTKIFAINWMIY